MEVTSAPRIGRVGSLQVARWASGAWGLLHVVGGAVIAITSLGEGPGAALGDLGSAAGAGRIPVEPGPVVEGVLAFHGLNIALFGLAVLLLVRRGTRTSLRDGLFVMAAADLGLLLFLLAPGYMPLSAGIWGPALLVVAAIAFVLPGRGGLQPNSSPVSRPAVEGRASSRR